MKGSTVKHRETRIAGSGDRWRRIPARSSLAVPGKDDLVVLFEVL